MRKVIIVVVMKTTIERILNLIHLPPEETCKEYFQVEAEAALDAWRDVRGLNFVPPTEEEIDAVQRSMAGKRDIIHVHKKK